MKSNKNHCSDSLAASAEASTLPTSPIYGMVDAYVQLYNGGNGTVVDFGSGGKGGSRVGIKGTEDLGGRTQRLLSAWKTASLSITAPTPPPLSRRWGFRTKRFSELEIRIGVRFLFGRQSHR